MKASSWAAVAPASRMWYPQIEIGCQSGISSVQKAIRSPTRRMAGRSGHDPLLLGDELLEDVGLEGAAQALAGHARPSAAATNMASATGAGPEIVSDVETAPRSMPSKTRDMSSAEATETPSQPTSPSDSGWSGS